jgi:hypothetical protein
MRSTVVLVMVLLVLLLAIRRDIGIPEFTIQSEGERYVPPHKDSQGYAPSDLTGTDSLVARDSGIGPKD